MDDYAGGWELNHHTYFIDVEIRTYMTKQDYRPNIYARLQLPWVIVMWGFLALGIFLLFQEDLQMKLYGFGVLALCMFMLIAWVTRINPRAAKEPESKKKEPKRKNKNPVYRQPKH